MGFIVIAKQSNNNEQNKKASGQCRPVLCAAGYV